MKIFLPLFLILALFSYRYCYAGTFLVLRLSDCYSFDLQVIAFAQPKVASIVSGRITDLDGQGVDDCTVTLCRNKDGLAITTAASDPDGRYLFSGINGGSYFIKVAHLGHQHGTSGVFVVGQEGTVVVPTIKLVPLVNQLEQISIVAKKPLFEKRLDKTIVNVASSALATGG